jgi:hypothetical protein|tara:strand:- start:4919 stop:5092 length:174 start_codon:yes stop_codon:yes gene_type:complete
MFNWIKKLFLPKWNYTKAELREFDKVTLEEIGRSWGIELDRRETKDKLVKQLLKVMK